MEYSNIFLLLLGGLAAGLINTLAGNGSAITLSLLIFTGLPADVANATNRIGALVQTITAVFSLKKTQRTKFLLRESSWFVLPGILGSLLGAFLAVEVDPHLLKSIIGVVMLVLLFTLITNPKKWTKATDRSRSGKTILNWLLIFAIGIYGGFLQMGIGIMLLAVLVLLMKYSLRDANIVKLLIAFLLVLPAFIVFLFSNDIMWLPGATLAIGQGFGAFFGARYILFLPKANIIIRWVLIVILSVSSLLLLEIPQKLIEIF